MGALDILGTKGSGVGKYEQQWLRLSYQREIMRETKRVLVGSGLKHRQGPSRHVGHGLARAPR
ncbi:hypothetical protein SBA1_1180020 [Candidatus Sulfotelmatobacter kueseliae]|uniref:Uncharacterized protein n=1 Tax=Candidatus Sulfotelmatobacter kueseliae TaxID=2042962 RepID=A0A2U3K1B3_9BACT|nr:hypothetical protein SBA1_1180020 [Candidatus Sulfotelmatobacter kueseliae]